MITAYLIVALFLLCTFVAGYLIQIIPSETAKVIMAIFTGFFVSRLGAITVVTTHIAFPVILLLIPLSAVVYVFGSLIYYQRHPE